MRLLLTFLGILVCVSTSVAQKFGYVDTEFITSKMPEYAKVQQQIDQNTKTWLTEVEKKKEELEKLEKQYLLQTIYANLIHLHLDMILQLKEKDPL